MRTVIVIIVVLLVQAQLPAYAQSSKDLPSPAANLQTLPAGSYVIPMDNNLQLNASGFFNLKTYGLIIHLLNNGVKLKWVIKAGKTKDAIDFSGTATALLPSATVVPAVYNFYAGPFAVEAADTAGVAALVQLFYTANGLTGANRPAVYKLSVAAVNVDIRYNLTGFIPKAAILNDGNNTAVHIGYMTKASIPSSNYATASALDLLTQCYTFASEPHIDAASMNNDYVDAVRIFTSYGGNFLAQCEAVLSYENASSGHFHTTNGITKTNTVVTSAQTQYPNPDLSYSQIHGNFNINQGGSVRNWVPGTGSSYQNNAHNHATGTANTPVGASVSKLNNTSQAGGLVFYIGNHEFSSVTTIESINGIRMYMNAFLTPAGLNLNCTTGETLMWVLSLKLNDFSVTQKGKQAELTWKASNNSTAAQFVVERSSDAVTYAEAGIVFSKTGAEEAVLYKFKEAIRSTASGSIYYRIRAEDNRGQYAYSEVRTLKILPFSEAEISTFPNPVVNRLQVTLPLLWMGKPVKYELVDLQGKVVKEIQGTVNALSTQLNITELGKGYYYLRIQCNGELINKKILKK